MRESFAEVEVFVSSAEGGSLSEAARVLGITPAAASAALKRLETRLGARLLLRSTRRLTLTPDGERYLAHARVALANLREGQLALMQSHKRIAGMLRVTAPADLGRNHVMPWLTEFCSRHPDVRLQLSFADHVADFYREPVDVALRYGALRDSSAVAIPLAEVQRVVCAAPAYLARRGRPRTPEELADHDTLTHLIDGRAHDRWTLARGSIARELKLKPRYTFDDGEMVRRAAIEGLGIASKIEIDIAADMAARRLQRVLPDWRGERFPLSLVYPERRLSAALRALIEFVREKARSL